MANLKATTVNGDLSVTGTIKGSVQALSGLTASITELNYCDGVTSNIQTQLNDKSGTSHTHKYAGSSSAGGAATSANKVNSSLSIQLNSGTATVFDGSAAKSINITPSGIGAAESSHTHSYAASSHTHNYAGSSSAGGAATSANKVNSSLSIQLDGGTATVFNGSAAKSINITPSSLGFVCTQMVNGSVKEAKWGSGQYDFLIGIAKPNSSNTPVTFCIPINYTGSVQFADDATYSVFTVTATSVTYSSGNSGRIIYLCGIKVI